MNEQEMCDGYRDGFDHDSIEPGENRSDAYKHGFLNGRDDRRGKSRKAAALIMLDANEILARDEGSNP